MKIGTIATGNTGTISLESVAQLRLDYPSKRINGLK